MFLETQDDETDYSTAIRKLLNIETVRGKQSHVIQEHVVQKQPSSNSSQSSSLEVVPIHEQCLFTDTNLHQMVKNGLQNIKVNILVCNQYYSRMIGYQQVHVYVQVVFNRNLKYVQVRACKRIILINFT